jgi:hypothetical protein
LNVVAHQQEADGAALQEVLCVGDKLIDINVEEGRWRLGACQEAVEGGFRRSSVLLCVEDPERMVDSAPPPSTLPAQWPPPGLTYPAASDALLADQLKRVIRPVRLDVDPSDE